MAKSEYLGFQLFIFLVSDMGHCRLWKMPLLTDLADDLRARDRTREDNILIFPETTATAYSKGLLHKNPPA